MNARTHLDQAIQQLDQLETELVERRRRLDKLTASADIEQLATILIGGGEVCWNQGPLAELSALRMRCEILERAVELQIAQVNRCQRQVDEQRLQELAGCRDATADQVRDACRQLVAILNNLEQVQQEVRRLDGDADSYRIESILANWFQTETNDEAVEIARQLVRYQELQDSPCVPFVLRVRQAA